MEDTIIGTRIGIYDVLCESGHRAKDGHKLYHVKCTICGWEADFRKIQIGIAKKCTYAGVDGKVRVKEPGFAWTNKKNKTYFLWDENAVL